MKLVWSAIALATTQHGFDKPRLEVVKLIWDRHDRCPAVRSLDQQDITEAVHWVRLDNKRSWDDFSLDEQLMFYFASNYLKAIKVAAMAGELNLTHLADPTPRSDSDGDLGMGWQFSPDDIIGTDDLIAFGRRYSIDSDKLTKVIKDLQKPEPVADTRMALFNQWCDRLEAKLGGTPWKMDDRLPLSKSIIKAALPQSLHPNFDRFWRTQKRIKLASGTGRTAPPSELLAIINSL